MEGKIIFNNTARAGEQEGGIHMEQLLNNLKMINYENISLDELLVGRKDLLFDSEWIRVYDEIKELKNRTTITDNMKIREKAFLIVYEKSLSDDLAAYVSDDFGLIFDSIILNYKDEWLDKLIKCYEQLYIPSGIL